MKIITSLILNLKRYFFSFNPSNIIKSTESATIPAGSYMFKVINGNTRLKCEICFKLTIKTVERLNWLFIVSLKILFFILFQCFIVNFEKVTAGWHFSSLILASHYTEAAVRRCFTKYLFLKMSHILQRNTWAGVSF